MRQTLHDRKRQAGAVAIIVALTLAVLIGFAGLALDGGQLYVSKTEQQNAADACALSASYLLTGTPIPAANFTLAENAGVAVAVANRVGFQGAPISAGDVQVEFGTSLAGSSWTTAAGGPAGTARYVRCTVSRTGIPMWFMPVRGFAAQSVSAAATAALSPAQSNCAIPMGLCTSGTPPDYGYVRGQWYSMNFDESGGSLSNLSGNFRWLDFDPSAGTPGCSGGGAQELACLLKGVGQCTLPPVGPATCSSSGNSSPVPGCVGQTGNINSLGSAFNTRFGIYQGGGVSNSDLTGAPPDFAGFGYDATSWPPGHDAYNGTSGATHNFLTARTTNDAVQASLVPNGASAATSGQLATHGADRRLVTVPLVDCASFTGSQHAPIRGYACVLLLHPYKKSGSNVTVTAEYLGRSDLPGSPCATSGAVGNSTSVGPMVPALVQ
ncbi:pilus assembly protein TadG-related protein [Dechloromonas sp. XY25]|uniref:Pilus assembly protein TadG-related protein n=1 Tax=Dechloromonas hankyongensis TaxID=2908002 RepID=A0ABS9JZX2_9RHOO|nr:TadE/TadG family type IV pilus assembly protein [Dechloromonas hankyongensis]MCG2576463.1 pilus assembly protein TadG-related protein [Dechloromonas hankyongensis]